MMALLVLLLPQNRQMQCLKGLSGSLETWNWPASANKPVPRRPSSPSQLTGHVSRDRGPLRLHSLSDSSSLDIALCLGQGPSLTASPSLSLSLSPVSLRSLSLNLIRRDSGPRCHNRGVALGEWPPPSIWPPGHMAHSGTQ